MAADYQADKRNADDFHFSACCRSSISHSARPLFAPFERWSSDWHANNIISRIMYSGDTRRISLAYFIWTRYSAFTEKVTSIYIYVSFSLVVRGEEAGESELPNRVHSRVWFWKNFIRWTPKYIDYNMYIHYAIFLHKTKFYYFETILWHILQARLETTAILHAKRMLISYMGQLLYKGL